jgi:hypothetical protein
MSAASTIVVMIDRIERDEFFRRLAWPYLIRAWSGAIRWEQLGPSRVRLELAGLDGLRTIAVARKQIGDKVFIAACDEAGALLQTGVWFFDEAAAAGVCLRRVHQPELTRALRERLPDFCCSTFLYEARHD